MSRASDALARLREGNSRFVSDPKRRALPADSWRAELADKQEPFAVILGCADSRVPPEVLFDQRLGDLFVIRVAGNIARPTQIGSVEFAVTSFDVPLVVVLGHSKCGAVLATIGEIESPAASLSEGLRAVVEFVHPSVKPLMELAGQNGDEWVVAEAVRRNVAASVDALRGASGLAPLVESGRLTIIGAECDLETGVVKFFEDGVLAKPRSGPHDRRGRFV